MGKTLMEFRSRTKIKISAILAMVEPSNLAHAVYARLSTRLKRPVKRSYSNLKRLAAKIAAWRVPLNSPTFNLNNFGIGERGKVSVILIPVQKRPDWIKSALESVLVQTYDNFELLLVDDGTLLQDAAIQEMVDVLWRDSRLKVVRKKERANSLRSGLDAASGEYVTWLTEDGIMHPDQLARLVMFVNANPRIQLAYGDYELMTETGLRTVRLGSSKMRSNNVRPNSPSFLTRSGLSRLLSSSAESIDLDMAIDWERLKNRFPVAHIDSDSLLHRTRRKTNLMAPAIDLATISSSREPVKQFVIYCTQGTRRSVNGRRTHPAGEITYVDLEKVALQAKGQGTEIILLTEAELIFLRHPGAAPLALTVFLFNKNSLLPYRLTDSEWSRIDMAFVKDERTLCRARLFSDNVFAVKSYRQVPELCTLQRAEKGMR